MGGYLLTYYAVALGLMCVLGLFALASGFMHTQVAKVHPTAVLVYVALLTIGTVMLIGICISDFWGHEAPWRRIWHGLSLFTVGSTAVQEWRKTLRFFRDRHEPTPTASTNAGH